MLYLPRPSGRLKDLIDGFRTDWSGPVIERMLGYRWGMFCQELKAVLKQTTEVWNEYHEGVKVFEDLVKEKERAISRMVELLSLPIKHKDVLRFRFRHNGLLLGGQYLPW